jgi:hypothetical protein
MDFFKKISESKKKFQRKIAVNIKYVHLNFNSLFNVLLFVFFLEKYPFKFNKHHY